MTDESLDRLAGRLQALADPTRLRLLELTLAGEPTATECIAALGLSQPRVARHLKILVEAGFLRNRRAGRFVVYSHVTNKVTSDLVRAVLGVLASAAPGPSPDRLRPGTGSEPSDGSTRLVLPKAARPASAEPNSRSPGLEGDALPEDSADRKPMEDFLL